MGIWIRTQDRKELVEISRISIFDRMIRGIDKIKGMSIAIRSL